VKDDDSNVVDRKLMLLNEEVRLIAALDDDQLLVKELSKPDPVPKLHDPAFEELNELVQFDVFRFSREPEKDETELKLENELELNEEKSNDGR
jgi:hypothetical protein